MIFRLGDQRRAGCASQYLCFLKEAAVDPFLKKTNICGLRANLGFFVRKLTAKKIKWVENSNILRVFMFGLMEYTWGSTD
ncbi:MAG: hypothetical protein ACI8Z1_001402 [Candidatus Azotimanducaceae bacterium]